MGDAIPSMLCGRPFDAADLERIRREIIAADPPLRAEIARRVCRMLEWTDGRGRPKLTSIRVGLLRLHRAALMELPVPSRGNGDVGGWCVRPSAAPTRYPSEARSQS